MKTKIFKITAIVLMLAESFAYCGKDDFQEVTNPETAILGKWELIGTAMYKGQYDKYDFVSTSEFFSDGTRRVCNSDPCTISSYEFNSGNLVHGIGGEYDYDDPWKCKFKKNQLEMIKVNPKYPVSMEMIYFFNFLYYRRIN